MSCAERGERRVRAVEARWELRGGLHREQQRGLARSGGAACIGSSGAGSGGAAAAWEQPRLPRLQGCCSAEEAAALVGAGARHGEEHCMGQLWRPRAVSCSGRHALAVGQVTHGHVAAGSS